MKSKKFIDVLLRNLLALKNSHLGFQMLTNTFQQNEKLHLSRQLVTDFEVPAPAGKNYFPYQRVAIQYASLCKHTLFAEPPGIGKTIEALGAINLQGFKRALIVCPASVIYNWKREIESWVIERPRILIYHPKTFYHEKENADFVLVSYGFVSYLQTIRDLLSARHFDVLILDECQALKNTKSRRTKHVLASNGLISKARHVYALSGTPIVNRPIEIYPLVKTLCPEAIDKMSYFEFGLHYCAGFKSDWGWDFTGASNLKILGHKLRSNFMVRRPKEEILTALPERFPPNLVYLEPSPIAKAIVGKMAVFDENTVIGKIVSAEFTELSALRHELGMAKVENCCLYIKDQLESGHQKIIVFAHHRDVIDKMAVELSDFHPVILTGSTPTEDRMRVIDAFQKQKQKRLFIGSIQAAGVGITLTAASYVIFVEFSWVPGENEQAIDRAHRIGQKNCVMTDFLVYENSLDERVLKVLIEKSKHLKEVYA